MFSCIWSGSALFVYMSLMCGSRGGGGGGGGGREKSQKCRVSQKYWSRSHERSQSFQTSIPCWADCWAIIIPLGKHHLVFRWRANDGLLIMVFGSSDQLKNNNNKKKWSKLGPLWQNFCGSVHVPIMGLTNNGKFLIFKWKNLLIGSV